MHVISPGPVLRDSCVSIVVWVLNQPALQCPTCVYWSMARKTKTWTRQMLCAYEREWGGGRTERAIESAITLITFYMYNWVGSWSGFDPCFPVWAAKGKKKRVKIFTPLTLQRLKNVLQTKCQEKKRPQNTSEAVAKALSDFTNSSSCCSTPTIWSNDKMHSVYFIIY